MSAPETDFNNELLDSLLGDFLDESDQLLTQLSKNLLKLDEWVQSLGDDHQQRCDVELLNEIFRSAHSLKGLSAMLGLTDINRLTHKIENVFDAARHDQLAVTRDVTELIFRGLDQLVAMVGLLKDPDGEPVDCAAVLEGIRQLLPGAEAARKQPPANADAAAGAATPDRRPATADSPAAPERPASHVPSAPAAAPAPETAPALELAAVPPADPLAGIQDEDDIPEKYLSMFVDEAEAALDGLNGGLLALEGGGNPDALKGLVGTAHKIKGSAASIGLRRAAKLAHLMEDLLEDVVATGSSLSAHTTDVLLKCTDGLRQHVTDLRHGGRESDQFGPLAAGLVAAQSHKSSADAGTVLVASAPGGEVPAAEDPRPTPTGRTTYVGEVTFRADLPTAGLKAQLILEKLVKLGEVCDCQPSPEQLDTIDHLDSFRFRVTTDQSRETVLSHLQVGGVVNASVQPSEGQPVSTASDSQTPEPCRETATPPSACVPPAKAEHQEERTPRPQPGESTAKQAAPSGEAKPDAEAAQRAGKSGQRPTETVRVDTDRLDHLMDLAGQLVINKAQFAQIGESLKAVIDCNQALHALNKLSVELDRLGDQGALRSDGQSVATETESLRGQARRIRNDLEPLRREVHTLSRARDSVRELLEAIHQLDRVSDGIQKGVMDIRMVPIGPLFARFQRVVRDISRANGKQVRLEILGEKTELDKRMIDELGDPLVHLVRNSADHGIEPPEQREAAGKPRLGTVTLDAFHRGNSIVIEVRDDGKGLDTDRILRKALDKGLVTEAEAQRMTPRQIQQLIWKPGLSTAEKVTDISGRGMGMDIVKTKIEELNGTVEIFSEQGRGTTITIKLPLTLAILPSLMVDIGGDFFAMPMEAVTEIVSVRWNQVRMVHGQHMAPVRGRVVSLVRLGDLMTFHDAGGVGDAPRAQETTLVIVNDAGQELGLAVDRVIGEEDVVIKSISENYQDVPGVAGASILGDGRVALILDVPALFAALSKKVAPVTC
jgi:two-component system chemotaxis sensor kinase CheA